jgi:hypothetical protein
LATLALLGSQLCTDYFPCRPVDVGSCAWVEFFLLCVSGIPDENARARILSVLSRKLRLEGSFDFKRIARRTPGFVGADLAALSKEAAAIAVKRIFSSKDTRSVFSSLDVLLYLTVACLRFVHDSFFVVA